MMWARLRGVESEGGGDALDRQVGFGEPGQGGAVHSRRR
jgi:hypothetical protein